MRILKNVLVVLLFCALGVGLGGLAFWAQKTFLNQNPDKAQTALASSKATPTPAPARTFKDPASTLTLDLGQNFIMEPSSISGFTTVVPTVYRVTRLKDNYTAESTDVSVYILNATDAPTLLSASKIKLQRLVLTNLVSQSLVEKTTAGDQLSYKQYLSANGDTLTSYEAEKGNLYVLVYQDSSTGTEQMSDTELETLAKSIAFNGQTATSSTAPTTAAPSASSSLLLQPSI